MTDPHTPKSRTVDGAGALLAYTDSGRPDAPPMVLLHALGETKDDWDVVMPRFAEITRVLAFDLRGHGDSSRPGSYTTAEFTDDVAAALDRLGLSAVILVGHSLGGQVALTLAARRPDLVHRLVIEDVAPPRPRPRRPVPDRPDTELPFDWEAVVRVRAQTDDGDPGLWAALPSIHVPTLIVGGGAGSHVDQQWLADAAGLLPVATLVTLPSSHDVHQDRPADFADVVLRWLADTAQG